MEKITIKEIIKKYIREARIPDWIYFHYPWRKEPKIVIEWTWYLEKKTIPIKGVSPPIFIAEVISAFEEEFGEKFVPIPEGFTTEYYKGKKVSLRVRYPLGCIGTYEISVIR